MTLASKKPALLLLPRSMESTLPNRQWLDKASTWQRQGGKAYIAAPAGALTADYARCGIAHTVLPLGVGLLPNWHKRRALTELIRTTEPTQIWLQDLTDWRFLRRNTSLLTKVFCFIDRPLQLRTLHQKLLRDFLLQDGVLITSSPFIHAQLQQDFGLTPENLLLLPPSIDPIAFDPAQVKPDRALRLAATWRVPENAALFLHCGDLRPDGGQISFFHALAQSGRRDIYAVILGEESVPGYRDKLLGVLNHYGLAGQVMFADTCPDLPAALWLAQAVVCASRTPSAADPILLAAQAMSRPLLVSDIATHLEMVEPSYSAWVYPASNTEALHNAVLEILNLGEKTRTQHGERTRAWVLDKFPTTTTWLTAMQGETAPESTTSISAAA
jgi:glycosyltransferase involved in cell wall biosynthesis